MRLKYGYWLCKNTDSYGHDNNHSYLGWGVSDASVSGDGGMRLITTTRPFMTDDLNDYYQIYTSGDNGKKRREYLESSLSGVASEISSILDVLSIAKSGNENPDVKAAWNTFAADVYYGNGQTNHDFSSMKDGMVIAYDYKGGTSTDLAILDAAGKARSNPIDYEWVDHTYSNVDGFHWGNNAKRYAILITDGAPQRQNHAIDQYVKEAADILKKGNDGVAGTDDDVSLITVGLSMGDVKRGSVLLYDIANKDNNGDPYFYKAETGDELQYVLYEIIRQIIGEAIVEGKVTDTVNEAFYPVDKTSGKPLENGDKIDLQGNLISGTPSGPYGEITESGGIYTVEWKGQEFTWDGWHGTFYQKAKEDFLGGNAVRTNDGYAVIESTGYKMNPGDTAIEFNAETKQKGYKQLETPRVNVNELNLLENNTEWTVYLGTEVTPREQLEALYNSILVEEVVDSAADTDDDGLKDKVQYESGNNHYRFPIEESSSDQRTPGADRVTFPLKDVVSLTPEQWNTIITQSENEGDENKGLTLTYDKYRQDCPGTVTIKLVKDHDLAKHITDSTGAPAETYTLTVVFSPDYEHVPVGQGGDPEKAKEYHTGTYGLGYQGHAAGTDTSINEHKINVFAKKLRILKADQGGNTITGDPAIFVLYRKATDAELADETVTKTDLTGLTGKYVAVQTLTTNGGSVTTDALPLLAGNEAYYLVETKAPAGYYMLTEPLKVTIDMTGHNTWTKIADNSSSQTKPDPYELSNWLQEATIKVLKMDDTAYDPTQTPTYNHTNDTTDASVTYKIINNAGYELPSTGGLGTTILYLLGIMLTSFAGAGLVMRKRNRGI